MLLIRDADEKVVSAIESMVADFVKGHPAERHPRSALTLRAAYFGDRPVAHLLVGDRSGEIVGMADASGWKTRPGVAASSRSAYRSMRDLATFTATALHKGIPAAVRDDHENRGATGAGLRSSCDDC